MNQEQLQKYVVSHQINPLSAPYINYMTVASSGMRSKLEDTLAKWKDNEQEIEIAEIIRNLSTPEEFFKWMRKPLQGNNKFLLRQVALENEELIMDMMKKRILTNRTDEFIECATDFFVKCKEDPTEWIMENYRNIRDPYAQSEMCLALGFHGDLSCEEFLMEQVETFRRDHPGENYEQGPLIAIYMLNGLEEELQPNV